MLVLPVHGHNNSARDRDQTELSENSSDYRNEEEADLVGTKLTMRATTPKKASLCSVPDTTKKRPRKRKFGTHQVGTADRASDGATSALAMRVTVRTQENDASERAWRIEITPEHANEILRYVIW